MSEQQIIRFWLLGDVTTVIKHYSWEPKRQTISDKFIRGTKQDFLSGLQGEDEEEEEENREAVETKEEVKSEEKQERRI